MSSQALTKLCEMESVEPGDRCQQTDQGEWHEVTAWGGAGILLCTQDTSILTHIAEHSRAVNHYVGRIFIDVEKCPHIFQVKRQVAI